MATPCAKTTSRPTFTSCKTLINNEPLCERIRERIRSAAEERIPFADYMQAVLYDAQEGYYTHHADPIGWEGDFYTSSTLGSDFGELVAVQFRQCWQGLGQPAPFSVVEMGAGEGSFAADVLNFLQRQDPDFYQAIDYGIVEISPALRQVQQRQLQDHRVRWCDWAEIPADSVTGCFFSNELVDALPVHRVTIQSGRLQEIFVTLAEQGPDPFIEVLADPSSSAIEEYLQLCGVDPSRWSEGYTTEIHLAALDWLTTVAERLHRGYVLTIDYGYPAERYYNFRRTQGTFLCYRQHTTHTNPYESVGRQDLTAHVNFTALERHGSRLGLTPLGFAHQGLFLASLGLLDRIASLAQAEDLPLGEVIQRRQALHRWMDPMGLGGFGVLLQGKGLSEEEMGIRWQGFLDPG